VVFTCAPFWLLLRALGCPTGEKAVVGYSPPRWLHNASKIVRREFLAAYLGGDGSRPDWDEKGFRAPYFCLAKILDLERDGVAFAEQVAALLREFAVIVSHECQIASRAGENEERRAKEHSHNRVAERLSRKSCIYGTSGCCWNRYGNVLAFEEINRKSRKVMVKTKDIVQSRGYEIIRAVVDSVFSSRKQVPPRKNTSRRPRC
jgi:hypothetical protein